MKTALIAKNMFKTKELFGVKEEINILWEYIWGKSFDLMWVMIILVIVLFLYILKEWSQIKTVNKVSFYLKLRTFA